MESELFLQPLGGLELDYVIFTTLSGILKNKKGTLKGGTYPYSLFA